MKFKIEHKSIADPSFSERLKNAIESSKILSEKVNTKPMINKKYNNYLRKKPTVYRISETDFLYRSEKNHPIN